jgi:hypothetical protein
MLRSCNHVYDTRSLLIEHLGDADDYEEIMYSVTVMVVSVQIQCADTSRENLLIPSHTILSNVFSSANISPPCAA